MALLEFFHILAQISANHQDQTPLLSSFSEAEVTYIMPCVLNSDNRKELDSISKKPHDACPIMVRFKCGFVPNGIFPAMIACLISNKSFFVIEEGILKNVVKFRYGDHRTLVTLLCRSMYYEVIVSEFISAKIEPVRNVQLIGKKLKLHLSLSAIVLTMAPSWITSLPLNVHSTLKIVVIISVC